MTDVQSATTALEELSSEVNCCWLVISTVLLFGGAMLVNAQVACVVCRDAVVNDQSSDVLFVEGQARAGPEALSLACAQRRHRKLGCLVDHQPRACSVKKAHSVR